jgi:hypothetical protein
MYDYAKDSAKPFSQTDEARQIAEVKDQAE